MDGRGPAGPGKASMSSKRGSWVRYIALTVALVLLSAARVLASEAPKSDDGQPTPLFMSTFVPAALVPAALFEEQRPTTGSKPLAPGATKPHPTITGARRALIISFAAFQALDAHSTFKALDAGAREANPAIAGLADNRAAMMAVKAGTAVAGALFLEKMGKRHPKRAIIAGALMNSVYALVVTHNYRVARAQRR